MSMFHPTLAARLAAVRECAKYYRAPAALPLTVPGLLQHIAVTRQEVLLLFDDGHAPQHRDVAYRLAYLVYKTCLIELVGGTQQDAHTALLALFAELEIPVAVGVELAVYRYTRLCAMQPETGMIVEQHIQHLDEVELVALCRQLMNGQQLAEEA